VTVTETAASPEVASALATVVYETDCTGCSEPSTICVALV
jgi:hypothetical protein